jgi:general secretion pathway protein D
MIFLRPVIISDAKSSDLLTQERYEGLRVLQEAAQPQYSRLLPVTGGPLLPHWTPATPVMMQPSLLLSPASVLKTTSNTRTPNVTKSETPNKP